MRLNTNNSVIPASSTHLEKAFDTVIAKHIESIPNQRIFEQWDPYKCPAALLGWLAWAVSVDDWNPDWPEQVKRDVIASSVTVHRHKGTAYSVKHSLNSLKVKTNITEWTDNIKQSVPYSFSVNTFANDAFKNAIHYNIDQEFYQSIKQQINSNKPIRSQFDIKVHATFEQKLLLAATTTIGQILQLNVKTKHVHL